MRKYKVRKVWIPALILAVVIVGCGDQDKNLGGPTSPLTPPGVVTVLPALASKPCPTTLVTATFSKAMNPATINATTFTVTPGVTGTITADATNTIFTFKPSSPLTVGTPYTATITTGAHDQFGVALAADFPWMFTPMACPPPVPVGGTACGFGILAGSTVTNSPIVTGTTTHVTGDVGVWPGTAITGFPPGTATGGFFVGPGPGRSMTAQGDLTTAYNNAAGAPGGAALTGDIGGQTKPPGVYKATTTLGITGNLTLDGNGDPNAAWIFQVGTALTTAAGSPGTPASQVLLINGAQAKNVIWQIGSSATLGTYSLFQGTIMAQASITLTTGATLNGRALARTAAVTLDSNAVNVPPCP